MPDQTHNLPAQLREARLLPDTFNPETRTIELSWGVGARVRRYDWWAERYYDEELDMSEGAADLSRLESGNAAVLMDHNVWTINNQIGVVERAWIDNGEGHAVVRLTEREDRAGIVADIRAGIIRNISVGYSVQRYEVTETPGQVPVYRAVEWQPRELSFVTVPADASAHTRSNPESMQGAAPCVFTRVNPSNPENTMPNNASVADATRAAAEADNTNQRTEEQAAQRAADPAAPAAPQDTTDHSTRAADILDLAERHGFAGRASQWIREKKTVEQVRTIILDELAERDANAGGHHNRVEMGRDGAERFQDDAVESILARAMVRNTDGARILAGNGNHCRGLSLVDMARMSLERIGISHAGMGKMEVVGRAFTQSTSDFPILLENAMHRTLQAAYALAPNTWQRWCARGSVSDFRAHSRYRLGSIGNLDAKTELGEFKNKAIPDGEKSSITAGTKGNIINLSREAVVNDDLGAFIGLSDMLGRVSMRTVDADAYAFLATNPLVGGVALFDNAHGNLESAGAPTVATVDAARVKLASQTGVGAADFLDLRPSVFLSGMGYGSTARTLNAAEYDPDTANKLQKPNAVRGLFSDIVDTPRIADSKWYIFADPSEAPVIEVAFLEGEEMPFLDVQEGFSVDGARYKVRLDFGIAAIDYRGAVRNG